MREDETSFAVHVDCDNLWIYETEFGIPVSGRQDLIYRQALPALLEIFARRRIKATFFVIGSELERPGCAEFCRQALAAGHRIGNHSLSHRVDFAHLSAADKTREIGTAHEQIQRETGVAPIGFRAPGYHIDGDVVAALARLGYRYDTSILPGPAGYLMKAYMLVLGQGAKGKSFGPLSSVFARRAPHRIGGGDTPIWEYPIATFPIVRLPIHSTFVYRFGEAYLRAAIGRLARMKGHHIYLLHAIDGLDHPDPGVYGGRLIPLTRSYDQRLGFLDRLGALLEGRVRLTEEVVGEAARNLGEAA
jgi:peptidoglycan-N-acetylglucosamine deacetylase